MDAIDEPSEPETPWKFLEHDDDPEPTDRPAEETAMHIDFPDAAVIEPGDGRTEQTVHYFDDEVPEVPDPTVRQRPDDRTPAVDELLIRQHYIPAEADDGR